jgi:hypothetical protein
MPQCVTFAREAPNVAIPTAPPDALIWHLIVQGLWFMVHDLSRGFPWGHRTRVRTARNLGYELIRGEWIRNSGFGAPVEPPRAAGYLHEVGRSLVRAQAQLQIFKVSLLCRGLRSQKFTEA